MAYRSFPDKASFDDVKAVYDSGEALKCVIDGAEVWIPHSQIDEDSEVRDADGNAEGTLVVSRWIAEKKGLV